MPPRSRLYWLGPMMAAVVLVWFAVGLDTMPISDPPQRAALLSHIPRPIDSPLMQEKKPTKPHRTAAQQQAIQWNATTEDGSSTGWQFGMVPVGDYAKMVILHPHLGPTAACAAYVAKSQIAVFTRMSNWIPSLKALAERTGPDFFEAFVNAAWPDVVGVSLSFQFDASTCAYESVEAVALPPGDSPQTQGPIGLSTFVYVTHVHTAFDGVNELVEGAHYPYVRSGVTKRSFPRLGAVSGVPSYVPLRYDPANEVYRMDRAYLGSSPRRPHPPAIDLLTPLSTPPPYWVASRPDPAYCRYHTDPKYKGYYLTYKGLKGPACKAWGPHHGHASLSSMDLLGRLDYGAEYHYGLHSMDIVLTRLTKAAGGDVQRLHKGIPSGCKYLMAADYLPSSGSPLFTRECIVSLVGGGGTGGGSHTLYFVGDSHMRLFYYGFLTRLGVVYPHDKVWRGDRADTVTEGTTTMHVSFIASYFLNLTKDSTTAMLQQAKGDGTSTVIAGVGQHHTSHCWSMDRDRETVEEALGRLIPGRQVVWFGIPAQPFNNHLSTPKPIGQSRKDCRNNQRHQFVDTMQRGLMTMADGGDVPYIPTMHMTRGMAHTSLDGAHFYTWSRAAWIDELVLLLLERHLRKM